MDTHDRYGLKNFIAVSPSVSNEVPGESRQYGAARHLGDGPRGREDDERTRSRSAETTSSHRRERREQRQECRKSSHRGPSQHSKSLGFHRKAFGYPAQANDELTQTEDPSGDECRQDAWAMTCQKGERGKAQIRERKDEIGCEPQAAQAAHRDGNEGAATIPSARLDPRN